MTDLSETQKEEISKILDEMETLSKETRPKLTNSVQREILDEIDKFLEKMRVKK